MSLDLVLFGSKKHTFENETGRRVWGCSSSFLEASDSRLNLGPNCCTVGNIGTIDIISGLLHLFLIVSL